MNIIGWRQNLQDPSNFIDMFGIISIIVYFAMGSNASYEVCIILMTMGVVGSYYKGIIAMNCISGKFRVLTKMLMETFMDMIPFTVILVS